MSGQREAAKVVLVTGSARGIGFAMVRRFGEGGARVLLADVDEQAGLKATDLLLAQNVEASFLHVDLAMPGAAKALVLRAADLAGRIDILINNARAGTRLGLAEETEANWDLTLAVDLKAAFFASQAAIGVMAANGGGSVVNIASIASAMVCQESPSYHAAKAGLVQLTRFLAVSSGPSGVRVNCIMPGFVVQEEHRPRFDGPDNEAYRTAALFCQPVGSVASEEDVVEAAVYLSSDMARSVTGACLVVDGGASLQEQFGLLWRWAGMPRPTAR